MKKLLLPIISLSLLFVSACSNNNQGSNVKFSLTLTREEKCYVYRISSETGSPYIETNLVAYTYTNGATIIQYDLYFTVTVKALSKMHYFSNSYFGYHIITEA